MAGKDHARRLAPTHEERVAATHERTEKGKAANAKARRLAPTHEERLAATHERTRSGSECVIKHLTANMNLTANKHPTAKIKAMCHS